MKLIGLVTICMLVMVSAAAAVDYKPGMWEHTVSMEMPGMPYTPLPTTVKSCMNEDDAVLGSGAVASRTAQNRRCRCAEHRELEDHLSQRGRTQCQRGFDHLPRHHLQGRIGHHRPGDNDAQQDVGSLHRSVQLMTSTV